MEVESEKVKPKSVEEELKKERDGFPANDGDDNIGSCKEGQSPDFLEKKGVYLSTNNAVRPFTMATSGPNAAIPTPDQLTIFYGGRIFVFDAMPAEKVHEIILIATAAVKPGEMKIASASPAIAPVLTRSPSMQSTASPVASPQTQMHPMHGNSLQKLQAELPIARRHSLQRFFEKRRDRLVSKNPYPSPVAKTDEATKPDFSLPDASCTAEKPNAPQEELQPKVDANLA